MCDLHDHSDQCSRLFSMVDPGAALEAVDSLPRFWRADWKSFTFYQCLKEYDDCLGGGIVGSGNGTAAAANATFEQQQRDAKAAQVALDRENEEQERAEQSKTLLRKAKGAGNLIFVLIVHSCCNSILGAYIIQIPCLFFPINNDHYGTSVRVRFRSTLGLQDQHPSFWCLNTLMYYTDDTYPVTDEHGVNQTGIPTTPETEFISATTRTSGTALPSYGG